MAWLSSLLQVGGTALSMYSQHKESEAKQEAAAKNTVKLEAEANYQRWKTGVKLDRLTTYKNKLISRQRVNFAKAGVAIDQDTALDVVKDSARQYDIDKEILLKEGELNVQRALEGADLYRREEQDAKTVGLLNMGTTLLQQGSILFNK